jgi:hypothetical protein
MHVFHICYVCTFTGRLRYTLEPPFRVAVLSRFVIVMGMVLGVGSIGQSVQGTSAELDWFRIA